MVRLLIGSLGNGVVVFVGYLLVGFLGVTFVRSSASEASGTDEFIFWFNAATFVAMALIALGASYLNVRLTSPEVLRPVPAAVVAVAVSVIVVALLNIGYIRDYEDPQYSAYLISAVAVGAIVGGALGGGVISAIRDRGR